MSDCLHVTADDLPRIHEEIDRSSIVCSSNILSASQHDVCAYCVGIVCVFALCRALQGDSWDGSMQRVPCQLVPVRAWGNRAQFLRSLPGGKIRCAALRLFASPNSQGDLNYYPLPSTWLCWMIAGGRYWRTDGTDRAQRLRVFVAHVRDNPGAFYVLCLPSWGSVRGRFMCSRQASVTVRLRDGSNERLLAAQHGWPFLPARYVSSLLRVLVRAHQRLDKIIHENSKLTCTSNRLPHRALAQQRDWPRRAGLRAVRRGQVHGGSQRPFSRLVMCSLDLASLP